MISRKEALAFAENWLVSNKQHRLVVGNVIELKNSGKRAGDDLASKRKRWTYAARLGVIVLRDH